MARPPRLPDTHRPVSPRDVAGRVLGRGDLCWATRTPDVPSHHSLPFRFHLGFRTSPGWRIDTVAIVAPKLFVAKKLSRGLEGC